MEFDLPKNRSNTIKVIGVGGGGSNAVNHMYNLGIKDVDFVICNTDSQALDQSLIPNKIQLGVKVTEGLGAGADPKIGEKAARESIEAIENILGENTKMVFITAGMGGGTGTGAAPIIAKIAKEKNILTVGIVTTPFDFEGPVRRMHAKKGIENLKNNVDSILIVNNNKLTEMYGDLGFKTAFYKADEILSTAAKGISEVITKPFHINIDLKDVKTVLQNSGKAIMGNGVSKGNNRALEAVKKAVNSPLLDYNKITGAKDFLLLITSSEQGEATMNETKLITKFIEKETDNSNVNIILGIGSDKNLKDDEISVTVIATGFNKNAEEDRVYEFQNENNLKQDEHKSDKIIEELRIFSIEDDIDKVGVDTINNEDSYQIDGHGNDVIEIDFELDRDGIENIIVYDLDGFLDEDDIELEREVTKKSVSLQNLKNIKTVGFDKKEINLNVKNIFDSKNIEELEDEPAYKRKNVNVDCES